MKVVREGGEKVKHDGVTKVEMVKTLLGVRKWIPPILPRAEREYKRQGRASKTVREALVGSEQVLGLKAVRKVFV